jgi:hypothetical protein
VILLGNGVTNAIVSDDGVEYVTVDYECLSASDTITVNGECTPVRTGTSSGCGIYEGTLVAGQNWKLCHESINTYGYTGFGVYTAGSTNVTMCGGMSLHGNPIHDPNVDPDFGDYFYFRWTNPTDRFLIDGGTAGIDVNFGGHTIIEGQGASVTVRNVRMNNLWAGNVSGFSGEDGNRAAVFGSHNAQDWSVYDVLVNRTGKALDSQYQESFKCEGQRTGIFNSVFRNPIDYFVLGSSIDSASYSEDCHVAHSVFQNGGPLALIEDYCGDDAGIRTVHGHKWTNNVALNVAQDGKFYPSYEDALFVIFDRCEGSTSYPPDQILEVNGLAVEDSNCSRLGVYILSEGFYTIAQLEAAYPSIIDGYVCSSDLDLDNKPANATDLTLSNMVTAYTAVGASELTDTGSVLTTTNGAGTSSTSLAVHDACWFPDPVWGTPGRGSLSGGFQVNLEGVGNVTITAKTMTGTLGSSTACRGTLTLSAAATWANGADVQFTFSGVAADIGITH